MSINEDMLARKRAEIVQERVGYLEQVNRQLGAFDGAIMAIDNLIAELAAEATTPDDSDAAIERLEALEAAVMETAAEGMSPMGVGEEAGAFRHVVDFIADHERRIVVQDENANQDVGIPEMETPADLAPVDAP